VGVRVAAIVTLVLLIAYHVMRVAATACSGSVCDAYIPFSLLLPFLVLIGAAVSGVLAILAARGDRNWMIVLGLCTAIAVIGPIADLVFLRDAPDAFVVTSTILVALAPVGALSYSFSRRTA
jgi:hypothetical protein